MINLLPIDIKKQTKAARTNSILLNYSVILLFASGFLAFVCVSTFIILKNIESSSAKNSSTPYSIAKSKVDEINTKIAGAESIMNSSVFYSGILTSIGNVLPTGVIIKSISLSNNSINSPINIKLNAKTNELATQLKDKFIGPTFSGYNLIETTSDPSDSTGYPVIINITVSINRTSIQ